MLIFLYFDVRQYVEKYCFKSHTQAIIAVLMQSKTGKLSLDFLATPLVNS
jgi:hypothetical protein